MTLRIRLGAAVVAFASLLVISASANARNIEVVRDVSARDGQILATGSSIQVVRDVSARDAAIVPSVAPMQVVRDVSARDSRLAEGKAAIRYFDENERATLRADAARQAIEYFMNAERATGASAGTSTATNTGSISGLQVRAARASGFDWFDAGVGASSTLLLAILVVGSLLAARHLRSGPLPH